MIETRARVESRVTTVRRAPGQSLFAVAAACTGALWLAAFAPLGATEGQQSDAPLAFEVASVRRSMVTETPPLSIRATIASGQFTANGATLIELIRYAYALQRYQTVEGAPSWSGDRFDIVAKAAAPPPRPTPRAGLPFVTPATVGPLNLMVQSLLAERFSLAVHWETRDRPAYVLLPARADGRLGPGLRRSDTDCEALAAARKSALGTQPSQEDLQRFLADAKQQLESGTVPTCGMSMHATGITMDSQPMTALVGVLQTALDLPLVDRTGLIGAYNITLRYPRMATAGPGAPAAPGAGVPALAAGEPDLPPLPVALEDQLGLKLERQNAPIQVLVIDRVEPPTAD